jgi:hypothetical protein
MTAAASIRSGSGAGIGALIGGAALAGVSAGGGALARHSWRQAEQRTRRPARPRTASSTANCAPQFGQARIISERELGDPTKTPL